jgi:flavorubredoxin
MIWYIFILILIVIGVVTAWVEFHEVVSEVKVLNPDGEKGTALVVYQRALRDFQPKMASAFAEGLASGGLRVDITTVSSQAPTDLTKYDLIVLGWPTFWFNPSLPVRRYVDRVKDFEQKSIVIICTAAGSPLGSCEKMRTLVSSANGNIVRSLTLYSMRPNEGDRDPVEIAMQAGKATASKL